MLAVDKRLLIKVARMYYLENKNQNEIAAKLGINRTTVSKYLKKAMLAGLVQISVVNDEFEELEAKLEEKFDLKEVYIISSAADLGKAGIRFLKRIIHDGDVVGFAWGETMASIANAAAMEPCEKLNVEMIPLVGGPGNVDSDFHVNTITYKVANAFKAKSHYLYAPAIAGSAEARNIMIRDDNCRKVITMWEQVSIAVVGVGTPLKSSNLVWMGALGREYADALQEAGVVGDVCSWFYDVHGNVVDTVLTDRTIAIHPDTIKRVNYSIGVAASPEKVPAIYGALKGKFINVLITDELTAKLLLDFKNERQGDDR
ncbi:hypothetical protein P22_0641 [Propionispora sp. 2/2-37]|uniref:sugar-binding transcriptional regulator n=1 Tax=Propionispora sp. 2/2-37 TaxID=1677858 RepID=UPI0006BB62DA|nr:sugar-binding transcriptional regulator [Propionispora sp. 2/2-37]CUH94575.1 hypothetical protein P22_0641 [Propionispora sp. 2/2-37]